MHFLFIFLTFFSFLHSYELPEPIICEKTDIFVLNDKETDLLSNINSELTIFNEICVWNEMYGLNNQEKCNNFKDRLNSFSENQKIFEDKINQFKTLNSEWEQYTSCKSAIRFKAIDFQKNSNNILQQLIEKFNNLNECQNNILYNIKLICNVPDAISENNINHKEINENPFTKYNNMNPFPKYKKNNTNPFPKYKTKSNGIVLKPL